MIFFYFFKNKGHNNQNFSLCRGLESGNFSLGGMEAILIILSCLREIS